MRPRTVHQIKGQPLHWNKSYIPTNHCWNVILLTSNLMLMSELFAGLTVLFEQMKTVDYWQYLAILKEPITILKQIKILRSLSKFGHCLIMNLHSKCQKYRFNAIIAVTTALHHWLQILSVTSSIHAEVIHLPCPPISKLTDVFMEHDHLTNHFGPTTNVWNFDRSNNFSCIN